MKSEKIKSLDLDLSNLEKYIFNTIFLIILLNISLTFFFRPILPLRELSNAITQLSFYMLVFLFFVRIISYQNKTALIFEAPVWCFYKGSRKISFETSEILSVRKSFWGIFSSFVVKIKDPQQNTCRIRIPAETPNLAEFISNLSQNLPKEKFPDLLKFHKKAYAACLEMEKTSSFLQFFCFAIPPIAYFVARYVWGSFSPIICILWAILSLIFPLFWAAIHLLLLKFTAEKFAVFSKVTGIWLFFGVLLYMITGIIYREYYLWLMFSYRGW